MSGSVYGTIFKISTWGESHGSGVGVVVDGCPAGLLLNEEDIQKYLDRRKPGQSKFTTARSEGDKAEILSGVFEGKTTGTPISIVIRNTDQRSHDYSNIMDVYRPGHADYTFDAKYSNAESRTVIDPELPGHTAEEVRRCARAIFAAMDCRGLSRVDFFVEQGTNAVIFNEINTFPGFTSISMYPMLWAARGIELPALLDRLIRLAQTR